MSQSHIQQLHDTPRLPIDHVNRLKKLKVDGFNPKIIYDIGSSVLHWTNIAKKIWPEAEIICFDAFDNYEFLYQKYNIPYHIGVLTDDDKKEITFYQSDIHLNGNSYYKENNDTIFPESCGVKKIGYTLDTIVKQNNLPRPDFVKMDVQGAEQDVFNGGRNTLQHAKYLILESQHVDYNRGAPKCDQLIPYIEQNGWDCIDPQFAKNNNDADYLFKKRKNLFYIH